MTFATLNGHPLPKISYSILGLALLTSAPSAANAQAFTIGNLALVQAEASASNTSATVLEFNKTSTSQSAVTTRTTPGMRISGSATSTAYVSHSNDGTLLTFTGANSADTTSNVNTLNPRAVVTFDNAGTMNIAASYTGTSGQQTRSATTLDNTSFYIADQGGLYTNGSNAASPVGNFRAAKAFGGVVYGSQASGTVTNIQVGTFSAISGGAYSGLSGLTNNSSFQDFYMISSGSNGSSYDILYTLSATSNAAGTIAKYSLVGNSWVANGTSTTTFGGFGLAAESNGAGAYLYMTTGQGALTANNLMRVTDAAGYNSAISITSGNNLVLATAGTGKIFKGVDFTPGVVPEPASILGLSAGLVGMFARRKKR